MIAVGFARREWWLDGPSGRTMPLWHVEDAYYSILEENCDDDGQRWMTNGEKAFGGRASYRRRGPFPSRRMGADR